MFEKICIKSRELTEKNLDISFLIDTMLFYGEVNVLAHTAEVRELLKFFDEETLRILIQSGRMKLHIRQNIIGAGFEPGPKNLYGTGLCKKVNESVNNILYAAHRQIVNNSMQNKNFADSFAELVQSHAYEPIVNELIDADFQNTSYLTEAITEMIRSEVPEYFPSEPIRFDIEKEDKSIPLFTTAYSIHTNIDLKKLNTLRAKKGLYTMPNFSSFLLILAETCGDNYLSAQFESEFATNRLNSSLMDIQMADAIKRTHRSLEELIEFKKHVLTGCPSLGQAFINGQINGEQLIRLLEEGDRFRTWLKGRPDDADLVNQYLIECSAPTLSDKKIVKTIRFGITTLLGFMPVVGAITSAFDTFIFDKLLKGWKPNHFIKDQLEPLLRQNAH